MNTIKVPDHLGGHLNRTNTDEPLLIHVKNKFNITSMLDIGCGPGGQVYLADELGLKVLGVDGDFTLKREKPELFKIHDFTKGKLELDEYFGFAWCCEFVEHVEKQYEDNWMTLMTKVKYAFITYSEPETPGHHHVNCEELPYWIDLFERYGFKLREDLTNISKTKSSMQRDFWKQRGLIFENLNNK